MDTNKVYTVDALSGIDQLPDRCIQCCVTSPPYFNLRNYEIENQLGLEASPEEYTDKLVAIFRGLHRVLNDNGVLWLNLGDTYNGYKAKTGDSSYAGFSNRPVHKKGLSFSGIKNKDLFGIPWMVAFALRKDGWFLRQDIIWQKTKPHA